MRRAQTYVVAAMLGALALCWVLLTPPGAGADEASHLYRAGELAEGHWDEFFVTRLDPSPNAHWLPAEYAVPEPLCYAQQPAVPVDCAVGTEARSIEPEGPVFVATTADNYPAWGHAVPAVATWLPGDGGIWAARGATAVVSVALVGAAIALAARRSVLAVAGVLAALTPMAWSTLALVNPSAFATAGGVAVWVALTCRRPGWLLAAGWAALALPRRDGLIWACLITSAVVVVCGRDVVTEAWHARRRLAGPLAVIVAATAATLVWDVTNASRVAQLGAAAPLALVAAWAMRWAWDRLAGKRAWRAAYAGGVAVVGVLGVAASFVIRPGGWDARLTKDVIAETRRHLTEAIGVLGWLDAPLPRWATAGWVMLVGALVVLAVRRRAWPALGLAGAALGLAIVTSWMFELQEGSTYGRYWQGRYSLPLLAGVPIALGAAGSPATSPAAAGTHRAGTGVRAAGGVTAAALLLVNVAAWAAARRWAVGIDGTHRPWRWGAELFAVHPLPVLLAHAAISAGLLLALFRPDALER